MNEYWGNERIRDLKPVPVVGMETENPFPLQNKLENGIRYMINDIGVYCRKLYKLLDRKYKVK